MLFEDSYNFRKKVAVVTLFYIGYFVVSIVALVRIGQHDYYFGLLAPIICSSLHFFFGIVNLLTGDRSRTHTSIADALTLLDWANAAVFGVVCNSIHREHLSQEIPQAIVANAVIIVTQIFCAIKAYQLVDSTQFDQNDGQYLG